MYCVPIKTGIKTNPHIFPAHQKAKRARKKKRERTYSKAYMHAILSPHHFLYNRGRRVCDQVTRTYCWICCIFQVTWDSFQSP
ncbi:hypothetical protein VN97_g6517 [Penicillium thymicola]|uniref:Uncharacterized protein n=1 Tax=Penicillium thymicola TaxID=293382 RepID=A0AAI9THF8_PENTH|nr:hypothetical protein VN97_g6517 [Penicillium thymicola]